MSRGCYGQLTTVGLIHPIADREQAVNQIDTGMTEIYHDVMRAMGVNDPDVLSPLAIAKDPIHGAAKAVAARARMEASPLYPFWKSGVSPTIEGWVKFKASQGGTKEWFWLTNWDDYAHWFDQLTQLREAVKSHDITLNSPDPAPLSKDLWDEVKEALDSTAKFAKYLLYGALGLGGLLVLSSITNNMRKGTDPATPYLRLAKR